MEQPIIQTWALPYGPRPDPPKRFVIHSVPLPDWMDGELKKATSIMQESRREGLSVFARKSLEQYARTYGTMVMNRYICENLESPDILKFEYSHEITHNPLTNTIDFVRMGSQEPGVLERMKLISDLTV